MTGKDLKDKIKESGIEQKKVAESLGITPQALESKLKSAKISITFIEDVAKAINKPVYWIIGSGETDLAVKSGKSKEVVLLGKNPNQRLKPEEFKDAFPDWDGLPMYNTPITATFVETYRDENQNAYRPQYYLHDPRFKDCDFGAIVTGDSMHSEIRHGDFVICKEILDKRFIVYGDIYYVVATNGLETCKYINRDPEDRNNLLLVPRNKTIDSTPLPKDMLLRLYIVKGVLRGY